MRTWTGLGADDLWSNAANWDVLPVDGDDVRIAATAEINRLRNYRILDARTSAYPPRLAELIACDPEAGLREFSVLRQLQSWLKTPQ